MTRRPVFGVGYGGRSVDELTDLLADAWIDEVADVRHNPWSPRPEFRSRALEERLMDDTGIVYTHLPALGNPAHNRDDMRSDDPVRRMLAAQRYRPLLLSDAGQLAMADIADAAAIRRVAVMCACRDGERCHRRHILTRLSYRYGCEAVEL